MKQQTYVLQGSMIGREDKNGPQGSGVNEDVSFTLDAADRHAVAYCMTTGEYSQVVKEKAPTLMARDYKDPPVVNDKPAPEPYYIVLRKSSGIPGLVVRRLGDRESDCRRNRVLDGSVGDAPESHGNI